MLNNLKKYKILPVDFTKPWWDLIKIQKWIFLIIIFVVIINQIFWTLIPFIAAKLFEAENYYLCIAFFALWFCWDFIFAFVRITLNTKFQLQCIHSIYQNAHLYLLEVDPKYHVYRSSGSVIAKIERAARGYEDFADETCFEIMPLFIGLLVVVIALGYYSFILSIVLLFFILSMLVIGYSVSQFKCQIWEDKFIKSDDTFKSIALENLTQIQLIRTTFASYFRSKLLERKISENMKTESSLWYIYSFLFSGLTLMYVISLFVLSMLLLLQIKNNNISTATSVGLFLTYLQSSKEIARFGRLIRKLRHAKTAIQDLFEFIPNFGKQTFPVLEKSSVEIKKEIYINIEATNIYFDYGKAILFNGHTFKLECDENQKSKLYGIIGESGTGKTTFLSILGGQLNPIEGNILINGIDIYKVGDIIRSQLIALQGQISSNVYGTVKHNLLLGLPENHNYSDNDLISVLEQVGLLHILNQHNGLQTILGEGGLNLSGGQRQRLNFAGLYLRANYYKPVLVLIDEPTSSLDEISEAAITNMIEELSKIAVTLVVAHRLKTIEKAVGIIDFALLEQEKIIKIYKKEELIKHSEYYRELLQGKFTLED